ncbi:MAG: S9 family peptidase, partial [Alphaproteobacteria bacterium]
DDFRVQDLWEYDLESGATRLLVDSRALLGGAREQLSEEEKARRERQRISARGIVDYFWSPDGRALLFPLNGDLFLLPLGGELRRLTTTKEAETDPKFSPDGRYVSFVRSRNLFVIDLATGRERALTSDGGGVIGNGVAEFVAQEEMDRDTGYWWSPDSRRIAFARIDESPVRLVNRYEVSADGSVTTVPQRYPFAGTANVKVQLGVIDLGSSRTGWIDLGGDSDIYLARVRWLPDSKHLSFQIESRDQKTLDLRIAAVTGKKPGVPKTVIREQSHTWINLSHDLRFLKKGHEILWSSERSGYRHLYLFDRKGKLLRQLTDGEWVVAAVKAVDEKRGRVYFEGYRDTPIERHLYWVDLSGKDPAVHRLTHEPGFHTTAFSRDAALFADFHSSIDHPPAVEIKHALDASRVTVLLANRLDATHPYAPYLKGAAEQRFGTLVAADGKTVLHYHLRLPPGFDAKKGRKYPAIIDVYGGPGAQRVVNRWTIGFDEVLARRGFVVMKLDNRGSVNRGKAFEDVLYHRMGFAEVEDQTVAARFLIAQPWVDATRIGVWGWSYGGYMTLELLMKRSRIFRAGMAVAPVSDWRLYDTHYTERFLGMPGESDAYEISSVFPYLAELRDHSLLLVHGMADDNVFFDHSVKLMGRLQKDRRQFRLMTYPGKRHGIRGEDARAHLWTMALEFFEERLGRH